MSLGHDRSGRRGDFVWRLAKTNFAEFQSHVESLPHHKPLTMVVDERMGLIVATRGVADKIDSVEIDDIISYHHVVAAENWGAHAPGNGRQ